MKLLVINPGSTSTKIAVYENEVPCLVRSIRHTVDELSSFSHIIDQFEFRKNLVLKELEANNIPFEFDAIVGRGGLLKPIPGGVYEVNDAMLDDILHAMRTHACNLGCLIASELAALLPGCRAFIADPGVVDELDEIARITGSPLMPRITIWHALNQRAIARRYAAEHHTRYEELDLIVCHLGGGISVGVHHHGKAVDVNNALDGEGPFSPERAGTLPAGQLIDLCCSGRYTKDELKKRISGRAGLTAHLGTTDVPAIVRRIEEGDKHAGLVLDAMIYQIAKSIGAASVVLYGKIDAILLNRASGGGGFDDAFMDSKVFNLGLTFSYPEKNCSGMKWMGRGPYRVWKNRIPGTNYGVWHKEYNNTITGESFENLVYPEFKGYHANMYWATLESDTTPFTVYSRNDGIFFHVFTPEEPKGRVKDTMPKFPDGDISFLLDIPAICSFKPIEQQGPNSQPGNIRIKSGDEGLHLNLMFDFRQ